MALNTGINVSKANLAAVLSPPKGINVSKAIALAVISPPTAQPPNWGSWTFPDGTVGVSYDQQWDMPGIAQVTYSVLSGPLPPGLSLTALVGNRAHVSGYPTTAGFYGFTLRAVNTYGTVDSAYSINIASVTIPSGTFAVGFLF